MRSATRKRASTPCLPSRRASGRLHMTVGTGARYLCIGLRALACLIVLVLLVYGIVMYIT